MSTNTPNLRQVTLPLWIMVFTAVLVWSGIHPKDTLTWLLEVAPALILAHCIVLMVGGHYTYAEVPLFDGLWGSTRNNYDKVGHFFQGFVPAILAREILLRKAVLRDRRWLGFVVCSICLAFSAFYELIEWWVAELSGDDAVAFLGTQGYVWDTQSDMALALVGSLCALFTLSRYHDRQLQRLPSEKR